MKVKVLAQGAWKVIAPLADDGSCELLDSLDELGPKFDAHVLALYDIWAERIPKFGPKKLGNDLYRCVDDKAGIYEFRRGRIRVFSFIAPTGAVCVCTHAILKDSQKVNKRAVTHAKRVKEHFDAAWNAKQVRYVIDE